MSLLRCLVLLVPILIILFAIGLRLCLYFRFLLLALLTLSQIPCKKSLEFLIFKLFFSPNELGFIPDGWVSDKRGSARKKDDCEVETSDKRICRCISDELLLARGNIGGNMLT